MSRAKPKVWYASAARNVNAQVPIHPILFRDWSDKRLADGDMPAIKIRIDIWLDSLKVGRLIEPDVFFHDWALIPDRRRPKAPSPMMSFGGTPVVTAEARALLEGHDIGPMRFHPIRVLDAKREAPLWPDCPEVYALNVGTVKRGLDVAATNPEGKPPRVSLMPRKLPGDVPTFFVNGNKDGDLAFAPSVLDGSNLWVDDQLFGEVFLSDRLAKALTKAGLSRGWGLRRCRIVG